ncbi:gastrokine-2 [Erinaceus europaeus]|uniref:Gastrokine-2 n=1 Tax=Erinaceus europaeus TaxID=9365 RepID=A0ABM3X6G4_ERIEU|nr:gastrokine-2 [Erinaceus europaeus]
MDLFMGAEGELVNFCNVYTTWYTMTQPLEPVNFCNIKEWVAFLVVLAIFGIQSHGHEVLNIISPANNGVNLQETVTIDNEKNTAIINIHAGSCSSTTIFDYKHGYIASRVLSRRACYIMKLDHKIIPALDQLKRYIYERQAMNNMFSSKYTWFKYNPLQSFLTNVDWFIFGSPIEKLCRHIPLYKAEVIEKPKSHTTGAGACAKAGLLGIFGISVCTDLHF